MSCWFALATLRRSQSASQDRGWPATVHPRDDCTLPCGQVRVPTGSNCIISRGFAPDEAVCSRVQLYDLVMG